MMASDSESSLNGLFSDIEYRYVSIWEGTAVPSWMPNTIFSQPDEKALLQQVFKAFQGMREFQKKKTFCDIVIKVEDTTFHAHKVVLAATSKYFEAMLTSEFQESEQSEATISGDANTFQILLDYAYSGTLDVTMDTVFSIIDMAHYLQFDYVMDRCVCFLEKALDSQGLDTLNIEVVLKVLAKADLFDLESLKKDCKNHLAKNFKVSHEFVAHMTAELMEEMLDRSDLTDEKEVFDATVAWLKHKWQGRRSLATSLLRKIRLGTVPIGHLSMTVFKSPKIYAIIACRELIEKALKMYDSKKPNDPPLYTKEPDLFATRTTVDAVVCIGEASVFYDVDKSCWVPFKKFPPLPSKDCTGTVDSCCNADGNLFVARGSGQYPRKLKHPQFLRFDHVSNRWQTLAPMLQRRSKPKLVYMKGKIYAIGGDERHETCERYDISANKWKNVADMPFTNFDLRIIDNPSSCVAYNGVILAYTPFGSCAVGANMDYRLRMYIPGTKQWSSLITENHPVPSTMCGLVVHGGKCYRVIGGDCKCREFVCAWHEVTIHELEIDFINKIALLGDRLDQTTLAAQLPSLKKHIFSIHGQLFVTVKKSFHKITLPDYSEVGKRYLQIKSLGENYHSSLITSFMFDKSMWL